MAKKAHCANSKQVCWTAFYIVTWIMLLLGSLIYHIAIAKLVPELTDLPANLKEGFYGVFKFNNLETQTAVVKAESAAALIKCDVTASLYIDQCMSIPDPSPQDRTSITHGEKDKIDAAFTTALTPIMNVCRDKYFGTPDLQNTADSLEYMLENIEAVNASGAPCIGTSVFYCNIYGSAKMVMDIVPETTAAIDAFIESDMVKSYNEYAGNLKLLHALPWITLGPAALFFFFFWKTAGTCVCCKGGGVMSCLCFIFPFAFFWLLFFVINTILVAVGIVVKHGQDRIELPMLQGKPTLEEFIAHVQATYPEFWALVFEDMVASLDFMNNAFLIYEVFAIVILFYGLCMCACNPYKDDEGKVITM